MDNERKLSKAALPKKAFDSEYMTEFLREVRFLTEKGIKYTFVKKTPDFGVSQYKYKKSPALFAALVEFYSMIEAERAVKRREFNKGGLVKEMPEPKNGELLISPEQIKQAQEILEKAVEQNVIKSGIDVTDLKTAEMTITIEKDDTI